MPSSAATLRRETDCPSEISPRRIRRRTTPYASAARLALLLLADKTGCLIDASASFVRRDLRVGAQRTRTIHVALFRVRRDDLIGRLALLYPLLEWRDFVEVVRTFAAAAVRHARRHEKTIIGVHLAGTARCLHDLVVIRRRVERRDLRIGPAVVHEQLAAPTEERLQVGIARVDLTALSLFELHRIRLGVEFRDLPLGVVVDEIAIVVQTRRARRLRPAKVCPVQLAAVREARDLAVAALERRINRADRLDLRGAQTLRSIAVLALKNPGIELTRRRVRDQAVLQPIERVAGGDDGVVQELLMSGSQTRGFVLQHRGDADRLRGTA